MSAPMAAQLSPYACALGSSQDSPKASPLARDPTLAGDIHLVPNQVIPQRKQRLLIGGIAVSRK